MKNRNSYHFDDDEEVEDGRSVRVPMLIMDSSRVNLTDTVRFDADGPHFLRAAASESSNFEDVESPSLGDVRTARDAVRAARDQWIADMCDAWKRPPTRDASQPDLGSRPEDLMRMRRHLRGDPDDDAQARRERAYQDYTTTISEAWKNPPGVARAENALLGADPKSMVAEPTRGRTDPRAAAGGPAAWDRARANHSSRRGWFVTSRRASAYQENAGYSNGAEGRAYSAV
jgi:hypothetical protein